MSCFLQKARYIQLLGWNHKGRRYRNVWKMVYNLWVLQLCACSEVSSGELEITVSRVGRMESWTWSWGK